jgi:hypothetical protein
VTKRLVLKSGEIRWPTSFIPEEWPIRDVAELRFAGEDFVQHVPFQFYVPCDIDSTAPAKLHFLWHPHSDYTTGAHVFTCGYSKAQPGDSYPVALTEITKLVITPTAGQLADSYFVDDISLAAGDLVDVTFRRDATDIDNTATTQADVILWYLEYTANKL